MVIIKSAFLSNLPGFKWAMNLEITGTGSYIPETKVANADFLAHHFFTPKEESIDLPGEEVVEKFKAITGIEERRYARTNQMASDLGAQASRQALASSGVDPETLDGIIVAHNFGDMTHNGRQVDILPSLATRVKYQLKIKNPNCIAFDILYGCPGWLQGLIVAYTHIKAGQGQKYLIVGTETLSRTLDPHDRDSMIFADGAGACVVEAREDKGNSGILSTASQTFTEEEAFYLFYGASNNPKEKDHRRYIKMHGSKIFQFALTHVPAAMQKCLDSSGVGIDEVKKILIHQANEKMDEAIVKRFYRLYKKPAPEKIMPMSIGYLGNSSVATVPTLLDQLLKGQLKGHSVQKGDVLLLASVGAGMSINAVTYRV